MHPERCVKEKKAKQILDVAKLQSRWEKMSGCEHMQICLWCSKVRQNISMLVENVPT